MTGMWLDFVMAGLIVAGLFALAVVVHRYPPPAQPRPSGDEDDPPAS